MVKYLLTLLFLGSVSCSAYAISAEQRHKLAAQLSYLNSVPEIAWWQVEGQLENTIVIGWKSIPHDFARINSRAAIRAQKLVGRPVKVWAVPNNHYGTPQSNYHCEIIAHSGFAKIVSGTRCN